MVFLDHDWRWMGREKTRFRANCKPERRWRVIGFLGIRANQKRPVWHRPIPALARAWLLWQRICHHHQSPPLHGRRSWNGCLHASRLWQLRRQHPATPEASQPSQISGCLSRFTVPLLTSGFLNLDEEKRFECYAHLETTYWQEERRIHQRCWHSENQGLLKRA